MVGVVAGVAVGIGLGDDLVVAHLYKVAPGVALNAGFSAVVVGGKGAVIVYGYVFFKASGWCIKGAYVFACATGNGAGLSKGKGKVGKVF